MLVHIFPLILNVAAKKINELNCDESVTGIMIQLPLPKHINDQNILSQISINKDIDGLHPNNLGL